MRIMTKVSPVLKKSKLKKNPGSKLNLDIKHVKVNLGSSFEQTWQAPHP